VAQAIQAQLGAVGIRVEVVARDASSMRETARKGEADMAMLDWWPTTRRRQLSLYPLFHSASFGPGGNYAFYSDRVTDSLIMVARARPTTPRAKPCIMRIDGRVYEAAPWLYLWFRWTCGAAPVDHRLGDPRHLQRPTLDHGAARLSPVNSIHRRGCSRRFRRCSVSWLSLSSC